MGSARAKGKADTRDSLRRAAFELFSTVGFDETTTSAIAKKAGVASGTVFVHASDKVDLLFLVMHDVLGDTVAAQFATLPEGPLVDRLMHVFHGVYAMYGKYPKLGEPFVRSLPGAKGPNAERVSTLTFGFLHRLSLLVAEAQARGEVAADLNPLMCANNVFALYFSSLMSWLAGYVPIEALDALLRASIELQFRGFRP